MRRLGQLIRQRSDVRSFGSWADLVGAVSEHSPTALVVDVVDVATEALVVAEENMRLAIGSPESPACPAEALLNRHQPAVDALAQLRQLGVKIWFNGGVLAHLAALPEALASLGVLEPGDMFLSDTNQIDLKPEQVMYVANGQHQTEPDLPPGTERLTYVRLLPNRYESAVADAGVGGGILAAAARRVRLRGCEQSPDQGELISVGASVVGLAFVPFVLWVAAQLRDTGLEHVAFCARDGDLPMRISAALPPGYWPGIQSAYIHGNRPSVSLAGAEGLGLDKWLDIGTHSAKGYLVAGLDSTPASAVLRRIGLDFADLPASLGFKDLVESNPIPGDSTQLWHDVLQDADVRGLIVQRSAVRHQAYLAYLQSVGLTSSEWAVVDIGWSGRMAAVTSAIIKDATGHSPLNLHFGSIGTDERIDSLMRIDRFVVPDTALASIANIVSCVETFAASGGERATSFRLGTDGEPVVTMADKIPEIADTRRDALWQACIDVASELPPADHPLADLLRTADHLAPSAAHVLAEFWLDPSHEEAQAIGGFKFQLDTGDRALAPVAAPYSWRVLALRPDGLVRQWRRGSIALSPFLVKHLASLSMTLRSFMSRSNRQIG